MSGQHIGNEPGVCSVCHEDDIEFLDSFIEDDYIAYNVVCNKCGASGRDWYRLEYVETIMRKE